MIGIDLDGVDVLGAVDQGGGDVGARSCAENQHVLERIAEAEYGHW